MKTAVIYARYSCDSQTEQSIEGQLRVCQDYAKSNDILIVDTYIDRAMTGTNDMRPDFQRMLKDSSKKQWNYVLVYKLDRFSRDKYEATIHKHTLKENGVKLLSAMENIPDSPEGIILESLLEGMNQYYSAELSQKVRRGFTENYRKGLYTGGRILYGYDVVDRRYVINEAEAEIVREIFTKYSQGYTADSLANELKARGVRTKDGDYISLKYIFKMIGNTKYNGKVQHGDVVYDNIFPQIVNDAVWEKVQDIRRENQHTPARNKAVFEYILSGKLICGKCRHKMLGVSGTSASGSIYHYYACMSKRRKQTTCDTKAVDKQWIEDTVIDATWTMLSDSDGIRKVAEMLVSLHEIESKKNTTVKSLESKRRAALKASQNLIAAVEKGIVTEQTRLRLKELEAQIAGLDFDIEQEKLRNYAFLTVEKIEDYLKQFLRGDKNNPDVRKLIVKTFVREIILDDDYITITYFFCDEYTKYRITPESIQQVQRQSKKRVAASFSQCSHIFPSFSPFKT